MQKLKTPAGQKLLAEQVQRFVAMAQHNLVAWVALMIVSTFTTATVFWLFAEGPQMIGALLAYVAYSNNQTYHMALAVFGLVVTLGLNVIVLCVGAVRQFGNEMTDEEFTELVAEPVTLPEMLEWAQELNADDKRILAETLTVLTRKTEHEPA